MMPSLLISVFILCALSSQNVFAMIGMGPLNIKLVQMSQCPSDEDRIKMAVVDIDGQQGFSMEVDLPYPLDRTISYVITVDKVQNGQIQKGVFKHGGNDACNDLPRFLGTLWMKLLAAAEVSEKCPIEPGNYKVDKFPFEEKDLDIKTFLYGRFIMNAEVFKDKTTKIACVTVEFTNSRPGESV